MNINYEYLFGYFVSLLLALSSAISVFVSLSHLAPMGLSLICALSCFFLNLVLFWRDFGNILKKNKKKESLPAILLTLCASILMYAFTLLSIIELRQSSVLIYTMIPYELMHITAFANAVGTYGLYIEDCKAIINHGIDQKLLYSIAYCVSFTLSPLFRLPWVCLVSIAI